MRVIAFDNACGISYRDTKVGYVLGNHTPGTDKTMFADGDSGQYNHVGPDNGMFSYMDRRGGDALFDDVFGDVAIVMVQADEDHILRNIDSVVYSDRADNRIAQSDSAIIADDDISYGIVQAGVISCLNGVKGTFV